MTINIKKILLFFSVVVNNSLLPRKSKKERKKTERKKTKRKKEKKESKKRKERGRTCANHTDGFVHCEREKIIILWFILCLFCVFVFW